MRKEGHRQILPVLRWLIIINIVVFLMQCVSERWFGRDAYMQYLSLTGHGVMNWFIWTPFTYSFLHSTHPSELLHIVFNLITIFFLGRALQSVLGGERLFTLYAGSAVLGGLLWLAFNFNGGNLIGASGAACGLLALFCLMFPNERLILLPIPISFKPKYIGWATLAINLFGFLFSEISPSRGYSSIAFSAHLGGMLYGWIFFKYLLHRESLFQRNRSTIELPQWFKKKSSHTKNTRNFTINIANRKQLKSEVDRILDKINSRGFGSLSEEEKRTLDRAKDILSR